MEELGLPELTEQQTEELCSKAEEAAREFVLSKVPSKKVETLNICTEAEGTKPVRLTVDVEIILSPQMKDVNVQELVGEAIKAAFASAKKYLGKLLCHSQK